MSPYRVIVQNEDGRVYPMCAMLSKDKRTGVRKIYILEKLLPTLLNLTPTDIKSAAYEMNSKTNSVIHASYEIYKDDSRMYAINRCTRAYSPVEKFFISTSVRLLSECQRIAMEDYISNEGLKLVHVI